MAIAVIIDFQGGTLDQYDQIAERLGFTTGGAGPSGLLFHWVTTSDDGTRVVDVWEDRETFERFSEETIGPIAQEVGAPGPSRVRFCEVHNYLTAG
jgi:hypothetical protein